MAESAYKASLKNPANRNIKALAEHEAKLVAQGKPAAANADSFLAEFDEDFSNYTKVARPAIKVLLSTWKDEIALTEERREIRKIKVNLDELRASGALAPDELYSSIRLCDSNIIREHAKNVQYLTKSPRNAILVVDEDASVDTTIGERDFTLKGRYNGWETDFFQAMDGMLTHGWDFLETVFDKTKPGNFANEHIGHENLLYPLDTKDFKASPFLVRTIEYTTKQLVTFVKKKGWNKDQVTSLLSSSFNKVKSSDANFDKCYGLHKVQKVFYRNEEDGFIYVAWSSVEQCEEWLREPRKLFLGKVEINSEAIGIDDRFIQLFETSYPIEPLLYTISEDKLMMHIQGRVDMDEIKQDAVTSLLTSFLTKARRSSGLYFASKNGDGTSLDEAQTNVKLTEGSIFNYALEQFKIDAPAPEMVGAINLLLGQSQMERGDVNYAVQSNKSTRKTASEIDLAGDESDLLSGVKLTLLSISLRNVFTRNFDIYQSRVKAGLIKVNPQVQELIAQYNFIIKPAGDVDIIERQRKIQLMQQSWQVIQTTAAADEFLKDLIKLLFPDEQLKYNAAIGVDNSKNNIIEVAASLLKEIMLDATTGQIKPEFESYKDELIQLQQTAQQVMSTGSAGKSPMNQVDETELGIPSAPEETSISG